MSDSAAAVHALVTDLRTATNTAPLKYGLNGDEVFAATLTVLCENIAKTKEPLRTMLIETVVETVKAAVAFEAGDGRALDEIWAAIRENETVQ